MATISVVIPAYNVGKYIKKSVEACINQTQKNIEIIIVDDGSIDDTGKIADDYAGSYSNIKVLHTTNQGLSMARNNGLEVSTGEFIYFLDADDWIDEKCLETCLKELEEKDLDYVTFDSRNIYEDENGLFLREMRTYQSLPPNKVCSGTEYVTNYCKKLLIYPEAWRNVYRKSFLTENGLKFIEGLLYEDNPYHISLLKYAERVEYIPECFYNYRIRENSITTAQLSLNKIKSTIYITKFFLDIIRRDMDCYEEWKTFVAIRIAGIWKYNFIRLSADDIKYAQNYKQLILNEKESLITKILEIYDSDSVNDIRNRCRLLEIIGLAFGCSNEAINALLIAAVQKSRSITNQIISEFSLNETGLKIGIYGSGNTADYILDIYEREIGKMNAEIVFIDSNIDDPKAMHRNRPIINVHNLYSYELDEIIVLSIVYEKDMVNYVEQLYPEKYDVKLFYGEACSSVEGAMGELFDIQNSLVPKAKHLYFLATPDHGNIGDSLITLGTYNFLKKNFPDYQIIEITQNTYHKYRGLVNAAKKDEDIALISGGGFLGSLWVNEYTCVEKILQDFRNNKVIVLPQSIFYENSEHGRNRCEADKIIFSNQRDLTICFRDQMSYQRFADMNISNVRTFFMPDMAFEYGRRDYDLEREGAGICLRTDKEKIEDLFQQEVEKQIYSRFKKVTNFSMLVDDVIPENQRKKYVEGKLKEISSYKLVVTDRLHCMVACVLTGTPCIAFDNLSHKVSGVYEWIKDIPFIKMADSGNQDIQAEIELLSTNLANHMHMRTFDKEMDLLRQLIEV